MTQSIEREQRQRALRPPGSEPVSNERSRMILAVRVFLGAALAAGIGMGVGDVAGSGHVHLVAPAAVCFMLSGLAATILIVHAMLADRQEFYRRGQLDGWMRGWRGQEPEVDDPLIH